MRLEESGDFNLCALFTVGGMTDIARLAFTKVSANRALRSHGGVRRTEEVADASDDVLTAEAEGNDGAAGHVLDERGEDGRAIDDKVFNVCVVLG